MDQRQIQDLQASYTRVAAEYARRIFDELRHKPLDQELLDAFAAAVRGQGLVCDLGCGPGHVARYLHERGVAVCGVDVAPGMLEQARELNPGLQFSQGDMLALDVADGAWAGVAAFYSIIHIPRPDLPLALGEIWRVLQPGGRLLLAFHVGSGTLHRSEFWGHPVALDFSFFSAAEMASAVRTAGFRIERLAEREPYPEVEYPSPRCYVAAYK